MNELKTENMLTCARSPISYLSCNLGRLEGGQGGSCPPRAGMAFDLFEKNYGKK